jgi:hypothetical protein
MAPKASVRARRQVELHLPSSLCFARGAEHLDFKLMRMSMTRGAAHPPQEELQVEEKPWVTDEDAQAADAAPEWPQRGVAHPLSLRTRFGSSPVRCNGRGAELNSRSPAAL